MVVRHCASYYCHSALHSMDKCDAYNYTLSPDCGRSLQRNMKNSKHLTYLIKKRKKHLKVTNARCTSAYAPLRHTDCKTCPFSPRWVLSLNAVTAEGPPHANATAGFTGPSRSSSSETGPIPARRWQVVCGGGGWLLRRWDGAAGPQHERLNMSCDSSCAGVTGDLPCDMPHAMACFCVSI